MILESQDEVITRKPEGEETGIDDDKLLGYNIMRTCILFIANQVVAHD